MFYEPRKRNHGLPHDPFKAIVAPRPIGWITSLSAKGEINLAPYSFFNGVSTDPPMVMFSSEGRKDSITFIEETKEFVCNLVTWDLRGQMSMTSATYSRGANEMNEAGLDPAPSVLVNPPRVRASPCALECKWLQTMPLRDVDGTATQLSRARPGCRHPYRRALHQGRLAGHRGDAADRARRLSRPFRLDAGE
jgi:flavin reductase (DIM6/NTAB) family NADH-FMN oxidoreductase RutF